MLSYVKYNQWKSWERFFVYSEEQHLYFKGETRDLNFEGSNVLEIGFGEGSFLAWAQNAGAKVYGTEMTPASVAAAANHGVEILDTDLERSADKYAGYFDLVVAFDVFEHLTFEEISVNLTAICRILRPGGHLLLRFPNAQSPFGQAPQNGDPTHRTALSKGCIEYLAHDLPMNFIHYRNSYRILGSTPAHFIVRGFRNLLRTAIEQALRFVYATNIPFDPTVVILLEKR